MTDHEKIVEEIQRKMVGASMFKSEEEKQQEIFEYNHNESEFHNLEEYSRNTNFKTEVITSTEAQKSLDEIYNFYVNTYIQPRRHYETFDAVNQRKLTFQPFILFMKNFRLLKVIFPLDKIKLFFKKYSNYGQFLTPQNFIFLIHELSHQPEAKKFFNIPAIKENENLDIEMVDELEKQELYNYMHLSNPEKYREKFQSLFQPFGCKGKTQTNKIKFAYRKFSLPQLQKKALPQMKDKTEEKDFFIVKNKLTQNQINYQAQKAQNQNPFEQAKSIVVSWESLKSKSQANLQKNSEDIIRKKYVKEDPDDNVYLEEYEDKHKDLHTKLEKKIHKMTSQQNSKNKQLLARIEKQVGKQSLVNIKSGRTIYQ